ncbi:MAG: hypothetical protein ACYC61_29840, partial [Isosphaeraceae bacterium]
MGGYAQAHGLSGDGLATLEVDPALGSAFAPATGGGGSAAEESTGTSAPGAPAEPDGDWLVLSPLTDPTSTESGLSSPWQPSKSAG